MDCIQCCFCEKKFNNSSLLKTHLKNNHTINLSKKTTNEFICKMENCMKQFKTSKGFFKHLHTMHYFSSDDEAAKLATTEESQHEKSSHLTWSPTKISVDCDITKMISHLRLNTNVSGSDLGKFVESAEQLLSDVLLRVKEKIEDFFKYKNISVMDLDKKLFLDQFDLQQCCLNYKSMQNQIEILKKHHHFIDAKEIYLGQHEAIKLDKKSNLSKTILVDDSFQYMPLIDTVKLVLSNDEVRNYMQQDYVPSEDLLTCYRDGENSRNNPLLKNNKHAVGIHLCYDEFLVNNPLGAKTHAHKIGAFYYSIDGLPPHLDNYIGNVHVLALCYYRDVQRYGINEFLKPFLIELKQLESDGVKITIGKSEITFYCTLLTVCADSLAAHEVLGFLSPSANFFCRTCLISREEFRNFPWTTATRRTKELHEKHCMEIKIDKTASSTSGVKCNSILNELKYFHCTKNNVFDIMHDILEGQGHYVLKLVIAHMVTSKDYDLDVNLLNYRINTFQYGQPEIKNKPSASLTSISLHNVSTEHKLQEKAVQMWCLLRSFPFLVADKVPEDDPYLRYILNLNQIIEIVFAPKVPRTILPYLHELILHHARQFKKLFPFANPINKLHHMEHYVTILAECGPLRSRACFKDEAKHQVFKKYGNICCNFKNIVKSMSNISQISQCSTWGTNKRPIRKKIHCINSEDIVGIQMDEILTRFFDQFKDKIIKTVSTIAVYGNQYEKNLYVAVESGADTDKNMPTFGKIEHIFVIEENVYLYYKEWTSQYIEESLNAYCIEKGHNFKIINVDELCDPKPFSCWKPFSSEVKYI